MQALAERTLFVVRWVHGNINLDRQRPDDGSASVLKIGHNIKYDACVLMSYGIDVAPVDDTMLISGVLEGGAHGHGMDELATLHLGHKTITYDEVTGTGKSRIGFAEVALDKARDYAAEERRCRA